MKHCLYFILGLALLSSCKHEIITEEEFSSKLSEIFENKDRSIDNNNTIEQVLELIEDNPESLNFKLWEWETIEIPSNRLSKVTTSDDGNIRVYNINDSVPAGYRSFGPNGTWIIQYRINESVYTSVWNDRYSLVNKIYTVKSSDKTFYLFVDQLSYAIQGEFFDESVTAYSLSPQTHELQEEYLFNTGKEHLTKIALCWEGYKAIDEKEFYSGIHSTYFEENHLRLPLVSQYGLMTEGYLLYVWDGETFKYKGIEPIAEFKANEFTVRIEILSDGSYKYTSWGKNKSTKETPDLILYNGKMECWDELRICDCNETDGNGGSSILGRKYTFENNGYSYCFEYGWRNGFYHNNFIISNGKKTILSTNPDIIRINHRNY